VLEELAALHPVPAKIVDYRMLTKLKSTYIDALPALINPRTGRLHTTFNQAVAATGRLSSSDPNLQNIPIRTEVGRRIREAFVADPGYQIVSADYSQIELRILAHFSEDPAFLEAFRSGQDIHQRTAADVFGVPPGVRHARPASHRQGHQLRPGVRAAGVRPGAGAAHPRARPAPTSRVTSSATPACARTWSGPSPTPARSGEVTTLLGRRRPLPEIRQPHPGPQPRRAHRPEQPHPGDAARPAQAGHDPGRRRDAAEWPAARLLLTVHDELVFEVEEAGGAFLAWVRARWRPCTRCGFPWSWMWGLVPRGAVRIRPAIPGLSCDMPPTHVMIKARCPGRTLGARRALLVAGASSC
jgi:DNA polymerase-1